MGDAWTGWPLHYVFGPGRNTMCSDFLYRAGEEFDRNYVALCAHIALIGLGYPARPLRFAKRVRFGEMGGNHRTLGLSENSGGDEQRGRYAMPLLL